MDIFVGVPQSKYAGAAILLSLIVVSLAILVGRDNLPLSQKFAFVLLIFLVSLPGLLLTLFQLTCMVTGTDRGKSWWCGWYSWLVSFLMIVYSVMLVVVAVMSLATTGKVLDDMTRAQIDTFNTASETANTLASDMFTGHAQVPTEEEADKLPAVSHFTGDSRPAPVDDTVAHPPPMGRPAPPAAPPMADTFADGGVSAFDSAGEEFQAYESFTADRKMM